MRRGALFCRAIAPPGPGRYVFAHLPVQLTLEHLLVLWVEGLCFLDGSAEQRNASLQLHHELTAAFRQVDREVARFASHIAILRVARCG